MAATTILVTSMIHSRQAGTGDLVFFHTFHGMIEDTEEVQQKRGE